MCLQKDEQGHQPRSTISRVMASSELLDDSTDAQGLVRKRASYRCNRRVEP